MSLTLKIELDLDRYFIGTMGLRDILLAYDYIYLSFLIVISKQSQEKLEDSWSPVKLVDGKIN